MVVGGVSVAGLAILPTAVDHFGLSYFPSLEGGVRVMLGAGGRCILLVAVASVVFSCVSGTVKVRVPGEGEDGGGFGFAYPFRRLPEAWLGLEWIHGSMHLKLTELRRFEYKLVKCSEEGVAYNRLRKSRHVKALARVLARDGND
ncbi:hypothetical protein Tco_1139820 [Tanacetum coccineum]